MKTCRICLAMDVEVVKIGSTKLKDFIEGIFDRNGFSQSLDVNHFSCFECKALLNKTYNFIQKTLRAQNALYDILKKNNNKVTLQLLNSIDRDKLGLRSKLSYKKIDVDLELIYENSKLSHNTIEIDIKKCNLENSAIIDVDPTHNVLKIHEDEVVVKTEESPDPLSSNGIITVNINEANNLNICDNNDDGTSLKSNIHYQYADDKLCGNESDKHESHSVTDVDHLYINEELSLQCENKDSANEYSGRKRRKKQVVYKVDDNLSDESIEKPIKAKKKNEDDKDFEPNESGESTDSMIETHGEDGRRLMKSECRKYPMKCDDCVYEVPSKKDHYRHYMDYHKDLKYPYANKSLYVCQYCGVTRTTKSHHEEHELSHGEKKFKCPICNKMYHGKYQLRKHDRRCHNPKAKLICDYCGKSFNDRDRITLHIRTHTGEKPYKCHICGAGFAHNGNRGIHIRINHQRSTATKSGQRRRNRKYKYTDSESSDDEPLAVKTKKKRKNKAKGSQKPGAS